MKVYTIGFTRKSARRFFDLLRASGTRRMHGRLGAKEADQVPEWNFTVLGF